MCADFANLHKNNYKYIQLKKKTHENLGNKKKHNLGKHIQSKFIFFFNKKTFFCQVT
jgi:hypothetical protein